MVRDRDGIIISDKCKIIDRWREYFSEMLTIDSNAREPTPRRTQGVKENMEADEDVDVETNEDPPSMRSKSSYRKTKKQQSAWRGHDIGGNAESSE